MKKEDDIKTALNILTQFKAFDRYSNIFGGFPRDLYFNKPYNDVDIYVRGVHNFNSVDYESLIKLILKGRTLLDYKHTGSMSSDVPHILNTSEFLIDGLKINVIFTNKVLNPYEDFDFDLCMFNLNEKGEPEYWGRTKLDVLNKTRTTKINPDISKAQVMRSLEVHLPKLKAKYPEFTFSI